MKRILAVTILRAVRAVKLRTARATGRGRDDPAGGPADGGAGALFGGLGGAAGAAGSPGGTWGTVPDTEARNGR